MKHKNEHTNLSVMEAVETLSTIVDLDLEGHADTIFFIQMPDEGGISELLFLTYNSELWETWDGLRTFPWREFGNLMGELLPFAA